MRAFLQFVPWGADGMSLDLMRRDRTAEPGVNELLIVARPAQGPGPRHHARVAELRRLPLRPRAGRAPRRRPGRAGLAAGPAVRLPLVPDREPLPLQRQVPADVGAAVPGLPAHRRPARGSRMAALEAEAFLTWPSLRWFNKVSRMSTLVMGVVNVTPDSFSDGGEWFEPDAAVAHGLRAARAGRRPARRRWRVHPPRRRAAHAGGGAAPRAARSWQSCPAAGCAVSVDTMRAEVAARAAARPVPASSTTSAAAWPTPRWRRSWPTAAGVPYVVMHWRGAQHAACSPWRRTTTCVQDVCRELTQRVEDLGAGGVRREQIVLDPGFGFAKLAAHSWRLLAHLDQVQALGLPGARRHLPQVVPRPAGRAGRRPAAAGDRARRGTAATTVDGRARRGLGRPGAPRALQPRRAARRGGDAGGAVTRPDQPARRAGPRLPRRPAREAGAGPGLRRRRAARRRPEPGGGQRRPGRTRSATPRWPADVVALVEGESARPDRDARRPGSQDAVLARPLVEAVEVDRPQAAGAGRRPVR